MVIIARVDAPPEFLSIVIEELLKKFPLTILEVKEEDPKYRSVPSMERKVI